MRAAVYKHVEATSTIAGLSLNGLLAVLGVSFPAMYLLSTGASLLAIAGTYVLLRVAGNNRPPMYWQHWAVWHVYRLWCGGRRSAAARVRVPQFPYGAYESRDRVFH